jgi:hypothetical protein
MCNASVCHAAVGWSAADWAIGRLQANGKN